ncbi:MAG: YtxH domain-containing protein [bacterium]
MADWWAAGIALMTAPASGRETRRRISGFAEDIKERTGCYVDMAKGKVTSAVERGRGFFKDTKSVVLKSFEAGKEAFEKEKERFAKEHKGVEC